MKDRLIDGTLVDNRESKKTYLKLKEKLNNIKIA